MQRSENVGKATTFVSHCWGAKFGDLVAALCEEADVNRKVYVDIFSARQWPSSRADSSHVEAVIKQCASFLAICSTGSNQREVFKNIKAIDKVSRRMEAIPREIQLKISFFRVWCLYEIFVAITAEVPMILKGGYHEIISRRGHNRGVRMDRFLPDKGMLQALFWYVDVQLAEISSPADHSRIFRKIAEGGGEESINRAVGGFILSHSNGCDNPVVQAAACSDELAIAKMLQDPKSSIIPVAACGYIRLMELLLKNVKNNAEGRSLLNHRDSKAMTPLHWAARGGHIACVELLVAKGADVNAHDENGRSARMMAAQGGSL
eukprot:gene20300-20888_t